MGLELGSMHLAVAGGMERCVGGQMVCEFVAWDLTQFAWDLT